MQFHLQRDEGQEPIAGCLPGQDLHRPGSSPELLVEPLNDIGRPERHPLLHREVEEGRARTQRALQGSKRRRDDLLPSLAEALESLQGLLLRRGIEDGLDIRRHLRLELPGHFGQNVANDMNLAALGIGLRELFPEGEIKNPLLSEKLIMPIIMSR